MLEDRTLLSVTSVMHVPGATDDAYWISENTDTLSQNLIANDVVFPFSVPLTVTAVNGNSSVETNIALASGASLWVDPDGTFYYTPGDSFKYLSGGGQARDSFQYTVADIDGGTSTATVRITITGVGNDDLIGFNGGGWYVGTSDNSSFTTTDWAGWSDAAWDALRQGDFNGDGLTDVLGLLDGAWYVGTSNGTSFTTSLWGEWANLDWQNVLVGDLNGDGSDDVLARVGGQFWGALSGGAGFYAPTLWASWADVDWDYFSLGNLTTSDTRADLFGFIDGEWFAAASTTFSDSAAMPDAFSQPIRLADWTNLDWDEITTLDVNGDGKTDLAGFIDGQWWVAVSQTIPSVQFNSPFFPSAPRYQTTLWVSWDNVAWTDLRTGDFDGDGRQDFAGRAGGGWWVTTSDADGVVATSLWATWSDLAWEDVTVGDYNGDGRDDIAGRFAGDVWVGTSIGTTFGTTLWDTWTADGWDAVFAGDVNGEPPAFPTSTSGGTISTGSDFTLVPPFASSPSSSIPGASENEDVSDPVICEGYPWLDGPEPTTAFSPPDDEPEICLDYPWLDGDASNELFDELLTTV